MKNRLLFSLFLTLALMLAAKPATAACSSPTGAEGQIEYFAGTTEFKFCDNTNWVTLQLPAGTGSACSTGAQMMYDSTNNVMRYCNASTLKPMGPSPGVGGAGCTSPTRTAGAVEYFSNIKRFKYCDGARWVRMGLPAASCYELLINSESNGSGVYTIDPDGTGGDNPYNAYCDMTTDGGGWTLVLNYLHQGGTNPALNQRSNSLPLLNSTTLGTDESGGNYWGHANNATFTDINPNEMRFYCKTGAHGRVMHFKTEDPSLFTYFKGGTGQGGNGQINAANFPSSTISLSGQTANLPLQIDGGWYDHANAAMTELPFYKAWTYHWSMRAEGYRWDCDDNLTTSATNTYHQVWVRNNPVPSTFSFNAVSSPGASTQYTSNIVQVSGLAAGTQFFVSIGTTGTSPGFRICADATCSTNPAWGSTTALMTTGQYLQVRQTTDGSAIAKMNIFAGGRTVKWNITPPLDSCQDYRNAGDTANGIYSIDPDGAGGNSAFNVYCNMTTAGGGWTLIAAQYEADPVPNWNEGIQGDYDPTLATNKGFALSTAQLPAGGGELGFGKDLDPTFVDRVPFTYSTGNIADTYTTGASSTIYQIHRDTSIYHNWHDPEESTAGPDWWQDTLTMDATGGHGFNWAFSPEQTTQASRGYAMSGDVSGTGQSYAWTLWMRDGSGTPDQGPYGGGGTYYSSCMEKANAEGWFSTGYYTLEIDSNTVNAYCDMDTDGGGWTLVLNYVHQGMTTPSTNTLYSSLPEINNTWYGSDESGTQYWGHASQSMLSNMYVQGDVRFFCASSAHGSVMDFVSNDSSVIGYLQGWSADMSGLLNSWYTLGGHSASLPSVATDYYSWQNDASMTEFPFYENASVHWAIAGQGSRWECDDWVGSGDYDTIHQIWVR